MEDRLKFRAWNESAKRFSKPFGLKATVLNYTDDDGLGVMKSLTDEPVQQFTGLLDISSREIYEDDILLDEERNIEYRVYSLRGGFGIKAVYWADSKENLTSADTLIIEPLADTQTRSYVTGSCKIIGNFLKK